MLLLLAVAGDARAQVGGAGQPEGTQPASADLDRLREEATKMLNDVEAMKGELTALLTVFEFHG